MNRVGRLLAFLIIFIGGYNMALPVAEDTVAIPVWFTPVQVVHGIFLKEALLMLYLGLFVVSGSLGSIDLARRAKNFALLVAALGYAGIMSAVINRTGLLDIGEALRLFLLAAYFVMLTHWATTRGPAVVLRSFLAGLAVAGLINLMTTFRAQTITLGILPFLFGQNGPGGSLGLAVGLGAWLMLIRKSRSDVVVAVTVSVVGVIAAAISYSKLSMLMALCGLAAWTAVIIATALAHRSRRLGFALVGLVLTASGLLTATVLGGEYLASAKQFIGRKFASVDINDTNSVGGRYMYAFGVFEIVAQHPFVGVGYSGFYDAVVATDAYKSGLMVDEDAESGRAGLSNPHNAFLYYVSANGLAGLALVAALFILSLRSLRHGLVSYGNVGRLVWLCLALAYFVNAMTLPTLYNTEVIYLPAAVAFSSATLQSRLVFRGLGRQVRPQRVAVA